KIGLKNGSGQKPAGLNKLIQEDDIVHAWYRIGCVLFALEQNRGDIGINPLFVEYYKEELDNINARHVAIAHDVRQRIGPCLTANPPSRRQPAPDRDDSKTLRNNLRDLADQLYTFVACGVHSSVKTDADSSKILTRLGFTPDRSFSPIHMMGLLAG